MPQQPEPRTEGECAHRERAARIKAHAEELTHRMAALADSVATSEDRVAEAFEESARLRPHAAERLRLAAQDARDFAARERKVGDRLRHRAGGRDEEPAPHGQEPLGR